MVEKKVDNKKADVKDQTKVCEVFEVEKGGKEKIVKSCGHETNQHATREQLASQNKLLRNILIGLGIILAIVLGIYFFIGSVRHFEYRGVTFDVVQEGQLVLYKTSLPVLYEGVVVPYNFYLRNDPRKLKNIPFEANMTYLPYLVINLTEDFNCDGDGMIGIANLLKQYQILDINVLRDENATCDTNERYSFIQIQSGEETSITQFGPSCYTINVDDCEILKVTEKLMVENFIEIERLKNLQED